MRRFLRIALIAAGLLLVGAVAGAFLIDGVVKSAVERSATRTLGVATTIADVDIGIFRGECEVTRLRVANPEGFSTDHFLDLAAGHVAVSFKSLLEDTVVVPALHLTGADMILERKGTRANYSVILENARKGAPEKRETSEKKFVIEDLAISDVKVRWRLELLPQAGELARADLKIPEIRLKNIGSGTEKGVVLSELVTIILRAILDAVAKQGGVGIPPDVLAELGAALQGLGDLGDLQIEVPGVEAGKKAVEQGKEAVRKTVEGLEGVLKDIEGTAPAPLDEAKSAKKPD